jgi:hypothetical protein
MLKKSSYAIGWKKLNYKIDALVLITMLVKKMI